MNLFYIYNHLIFILFGCGLREGYASTDESANPDALSNPVLPDESLLSMPFLLKSWFTPSIKVRCGKPFLLRKNKSWTLRELSAENESKFDGDVWNARALIEKERTLYEAHPFY